MICSRRMPRIPYAPDFQAFAEAWIGFFPELQLGYEACKQYPLAVIFAGDGDAQRHHFRLTVNKMVFVGGAKIMTQYK